MLKANWSIKTSKTTTMRILDMKDFKVLLELAMDGYSLKNYVFKQCRAVGALKLCAIKYKLESILLKLIWKMDTELADN